jgi:hypothetical protein
MQQMLPPAHSASNESLDGSAALHDLWQRQSCSLIATYLLREHIAAHPAVLLAACLTACLLLLPPCVCSFPMGFLSDRLYAGIARRTFSHPSQPHCLYGVSKVVHTPVTAAWAAEHFPGRPLQLLLSVASWQLLRGFEVEAACCCCTSIADEAAAAAVECLRHSIASWQVLPGIDVEEMPAGTALQHC